MTNEQYDACEHRLTSVEELLGVPATESSTEIDIHMIHDFKDHPFN